MAKEDDSLTEGVEVRATGAGKFQVEIRTPAGRFLADEPREVGGLGAGPTPYDLLASALGACTVMTLRLYADRKGWPLKGVTARVLHGRAGLAGKDRFAREIVLDGELSPDQRRRLLEIANRCPVHQTLERGSDIVTVLAEPPLGPSPAASATEHASHMSQACED
jgi:putative redox protein